MSIKILEKNDLNNEIKNQIRQLFKQLNAHITQLDIDAVLNDTNNVIFVCCRNKDRIITGMAALSTYKVISGHKGMIEDVVVDQDHRGKGIGRKLMEKLLKEGKSKGLDEVLLFSGHHRLSAIELYKSLGFTLKESGLYIKTL